MYDALVIGDVFIDQILTGFPALPRPGEEAFARSLHREAGGGAAITACGLARLGYRVALVAAVGREDGAWLLRRIADCGVDISLVQEADLPTATTVSVSTPEDRMFYTYQGANEHLQLVNIPSAQAIHFARCPTQAQAAQLACWSRQGVFISLDTGWHPAWLGDPQNLPYLRACMPFPNEMEARQLTGEQGPERVLQALARAGLSRVAVKLGSQGAALLWDGQCYRQPALQVEVQDTTGAGDCFDAGFLAAWLRGLPPQTCLAVAVACGSLSTRATGGLAGFPTWSDLQPWLT